MSVPIQQEQMKQDQLMAPEHDTWLKYWDELSVDYGEYMPELSKKTFFEAVTNPSETFTEWLSGFSMFFFHQIAENMQIIFWLLLFLVIGSILQILHQSFSHQAAAEVSPLILTGLLLMTVIKSIQKCLEYFYDALHMMGDFLYALLPLYMASITFSGGPASSAVSYPIMLAMIHFSMLLLKTVIIPLFILSIFFDLANTFSSSFNTGKFAAFCRQLGLWILGLSAVISTTILSVQTVTASVADGVAAKSLKTMVGTFIPFVGKVVSDTADLLLASSVLAKNAIGLAGACILLLIVLFPAIKILVIALMYRLSAVVMEPVGHPSLIQAVDAVSKGLFHIGAALLFICCNFFLAVIILLFVSNIPLMIR
ncbi:stage III sporulation protein AE [Jeotgalibacillus sp. R-1-5s-1]|uniref:stage III sporulation protein AE n=1 Tax=Jeotgalibacillus sp. R-1-5s-1 TaxID=2555897 RepID=UPI0010693143|nr:stage III sporulation protein AE [Jeotgalibacillus sp. R-1-5s-1]TFD92250.1 hypothetical protein E2491_15770 [Jeotgalibacillus sp. R-1-5s-1]